MPIEPKDALEVFGVTDLTKFETVDDFKAEIEKDWLKAATAHNNPDVKKRVVGTFHRKGAKQLEELNNTFELGLEIGDGADLLDLIPKFGEAIKPKFDGIKDMEAKLKTAAPKEALEKFEADLKEKDKKLKAFEADATKWKGQYDELFKTVETDKKTSKIDGEWNGALSSITFSPQVDDLKKEGFVSKMKKEFQILLDEEGKPYAANAKGEPLMHPKKAAERWTLAEALKAKADELKLIGVNPHGNKPVAGPVRTTPVQEPSQTQFGRRERKPAPRLM